MHSSAKAATAAEKRRWQRFVDIGCVACYKRGHYRQPEVHHLNSASRRRGHGFTIPLCPYHHRSVPINGYGMKHMEGLLGPSLASSPRKFRAEFGTDDELLFLTNDLIRRLASR